MADRKSYPSDLTDEQWALIEPLLPAAKPGGRPRTTDLREVVNTLLYQNRTGCQWDYLPHDLVAKGTAYDYFARWQAADGPADAAKPPQNPLPSPRIAPSPPFLASAARLDCTGPPFVN